MHELSIVMSILEIATREAEKEQAQMIEEIELDIGCLSSIDMDAFDFAWEQAVKDTILEKAGKTINRIMGKAKCCRCETVFPVQNLYDTCPVCGVSGSIILQGKELRVKSIVIS
jgi:hydrogenase nickel incorporation protein HypA/HybF